MLSFENLMIAAETREVEMPILALADNVKVKIFTGSQVKAMRAEAVVAGEVSNDRFEQLLFMRGLIEPAVTDDQYKELYEGAYGVYQAILIAIMEANGMTALANREQRRAFQAGSR